MFTLKATFDMLCLGENKVEIELGIHPVYLIFTLCGSPVARRLDNVIHRIYSAISNLCKNASKVAERKVCTTVT